MADRVNQKPGQEGQNNIAAFLQNLPDEQLSELRTLAKKEMKRRGIVLPRKQGEGGKQKKAGGGGKRKGASEDAV
jgi:hypothetical protein